MENITIFAAKIAAMKEGFSGERSIVLPPMTIEAEADDPLVSSLYITDIGYYPHADSHYCERREGIGQYVLIYCMEGRGWVEVDGHKMAVGSSQYVVLPAHKPHAYGADHADPWTIYWIHYCGAHAEIYSEGAYTPLDITPAINSRISERNHVFEEIFSAIEHGTDRESLRYASSLLHYYLASMRYLRHYRAAATLPAKNPQAETDIVAAAIHYMQENLEKRLQLEAIARYTGFSASHFSLLFRRQTGQSPLNYFNRMKIERACHLLTTTGMHVNQICHKVGIEDCYYFSRLFKQTTGLSPKHYRLEHQQQTKQQCQS